MPSHRFDALAFIEDLPAQRVLALYPEARPWVHSLRLIVARDAEAYRYLHESIRRFPTQRELARRMREAGFAKVTWRDMTLGVVALHAGWRI